MLALVCTSYALPLLLPSLLHALPLHMPSLIHALPLLCPPVSLSSHSSCLPLLLHSHSSCSPTFLPSHFSCPPTPSALPLLLPSYNFCTFVPFLSGRAWEGKRSRRAGGVGGQEEWEGRRAGLVPTPRKPFFLSSFNSDKKIKKYRLSRSLY